MVRLGFRFNASLLIFLLVLGFVSLAYLACNEDPIFEKRSDHGTLMNLADDDTPYDDDTGDDDDNDDNDNDNDNNNDNDTADDDTTDDDNDTSPADDDDDTSPVA
jgi:hypothetical protein